MVLAKLGSLVSTFPGPGLPPEWISTGSPANVTANSAQIPAATDFGTRISTPAFYDPTSSAIFGKLTLSTPRSYTTTPPAPTFTPYNRIGAQQPGGVQCKVLSGLVPGFTVGQQAHGQMKPTIDAYETLVGDHIEAIGVGLPTDLGDASGILSALSGETRFIRFALPLVPMSNGSVNALINSTTYNSQITAMFTQMVAAGFGGLNVSCSVWEYNSGTSNGSNSSLASNRWSTGFIDPQTGVRNGITNVKAGCAKMESLARAAGYTGYFEWNGGNLDSSALPIATAMPTHATGGDKVKSLWGWDVYAAQGGSYTKNDVTSVWGAVNSLYDTYLVYCKANGYMMAHGEYGQIYKASSPYGINDTNQWYPLWYAKLAANAKWVAYAIHYQQNQPYTPGTVLDESHQIAFCGGRQGVPSTTVGTGNFAIGATMLFQNGSAHTAATMGTLHNVADTGVWVLTNDPNKAKARDSWIATFGGVGGAAGKGAAGLGIPYVVSGSPTTTGPKAQVILTPGGSHNPVVNLVLEFDYDKTQSSLQVNFVDDGTVVNTAAIATPTIWWRIRDDGTNVHWETSTDATSWTNLRTAARPVWWNATDGVQVAITSHNDDGTQTISPLIVSNINSTAGVISGGGGTDLAVFDKFNVSPAPPGGVRNLLSHISGNTVALTWDAPSTGITQGYTITATPLNTSSPNLPPQNVTTTAATFLNVLAGSSYVFTVTPFNTAGAGPGTATNAVSITATGTTGGAGGGTSTGTPTPALGALTPNALPTTPLPVAYYPLTLTDGADDGDSLANAAIQRLADLIGQGWRPYAGNVEVAAVAVTSYIAADLRTLVKAAGEALYSAFGQQILQLPQHVDSPSQIVTTWTALDTNGHTIPAGTQVSYPGSGSTPLTFTTRGDLVIPAGEDSITGIVMLSDQTGAYTNGVQTGPLEIQGSIIWLDSVVVTTAGTGGQDAETDTDYRTRLVQWVKSLALTAVLPMDYAMAAQQFSAAVYRAYAVPNYDANNPSTAAVDRTVSVFLLGADGLPVPPDVAATVAAQMALLRESNFKVVVVDNMGNAVSPVYVNVDITATVVTRTGYAQADVKHACEQALGDYLNPAYWEGGFTTPPSWSGRTIIRPHDLAAILTAVPGVDHIDQLTVGGGATSIEGTDNYQLSPPSFTRAVLPAGTYTGSHWSSPSTITVTANAPSYA